MPTNSTQNKPQPPEMPTEEKDFYKTLAGEMIKASISRIESNASSTLTIASAIATIYGAILGFWVTSQNTLTPTGSVVIAIPEILLIFSVISTAMAIVPMGLTQVSVCSPDLTRDAYQKIVKSKTLRMKVSFILLVAALTFILIVVLALSAYRDVLLQKIVSA